MKEFDRITGCTGYRLTLNDPKRDMELEDCFKATWLALYTKDKQAHPCPQVLPTSPDANPSGPPFHEGFKAIPEL